MSMNDEEFEQSLQALEQAMWPSTAGKLRARDTAQREALARVEAELAEAVGFLRSARYLNGDDLEAIDDFVLRHTQAEQRDTAQAHLAEALLLIRDAKEGLRTGPDYGWEGRLANQLGEFLARHAQAEQQEAQGAQAGDDYFASPEEYAEQRAALATQPAVPIDAARVLELWEDSQRCCNDGFALRFARAIEAEAKTAVRGAEQ